MDFTIYNPSTGQILRTGSCPEDSFQLQAQSNEEITEGLYQDDMFYWDNGFVEKPPKPEGYCYFDYSLKQWVLDINRLTISIISRRNQLLAQSDWTQLPDVPLSTKELWATYRQALRDLTDQPGFPQDITWPTIEPKVPALEP